MTDNNGSLVLYRALERRAIEARLAHDSAGADLLQAEADHLLRSIRLHSMKLMREQVGAMA